MGRGNRDCDQASRSARSLLFGPRRNFINIDSDLAIASAREQLKNGQNGPAMVLLRRHKDKLGSDEAFSALMGDVASQAIFSAMPEVNEYSFKNFRLDFDYEKPAISFSDDEGELKYVSNDLSDELIKQIQSSNGPVELDRDLVRKSVFSSPTFGKFNKRLLVDMDDNALLQETYNLRNSKSALGQALRERLATSLISKVEEDSRSIASSLNLVSHGSPKVTYLRRGGRKATLLHLIEGGSTLCGKDVTWHHNYNARGSWRSADNTQHKHCKKCEKAMPENFFNPAEESDSYSLLDRAEYDKLRRKARRKAGELLSGNSAPTSEMVEAVSNELSQSLLPVKRKAIAVKIAGNLNPDNSGVGPGQLRNLIGWSIGSELYKKYNYDATKIKTPTPRQIAGALKAWPEKTDEEVQLELAKLIFRVNGKRVPKNFLS